MSDEIAFQADVVGIPSSALATASYFQGLLKAASADDVAPLAVQHLQDIGSLFHCNGPWAERLPNLLQRASSFRLQRLGAMIGWAKGDVPSHMSLSAGGRAASLLCFVLANLFPDEYHVGKILYRFSQKCLPPASSTNASMSQLSQAASCVAAKLQCLGFGNHVADHVTRIRLFFLQADLPLPGNIMADIAPEHMVDLLVNISIALRDDKLALHISGTSGVAWLVSIVLAICPDDVLLDIEGNVVQGGMRDNIHISISEDEGPLMLRLESRANPAANFPSWIPVARHTEPAQFLPPTELSLSFSWEGSLRSYFALHLGPSLRPGCDLNAIFQSLSTLALFLVQTRQPGVIVGLRDFMGPDYEAMAVQSLSTTLVAPNIPLATGNTFAGLVRRLESTSRQVFEPDFFNHCSRTLCHGIFRIVLQLLVIPSSSTTCIFSFWNRIHSNSNTPLVSLYCDESSRNLRVNENDERKYFWRLDGGTTLILHNHTPDGLCPYFHTYIVEHGLDFQLPPELSVLSISRCGSTIYPQILDDPVVTNPRFMPFRLVDGRLRMDNACFSAIVTDNKVTSSVADLPIMKSEPVDIVPLNSTAGMDIVFRTLPDSYGGKDVLNLRAEVRSSINIGPVNLWQCYQGCWNLTYAEPCSHVRTTPYRWYPKRDESENWRRFYFLALIDSTMISHGTCSSPYVPSTSALVSLTLNSGLAQFIQCALAHNSSVKMVYQGDTCLECIMAVPTCSEGQTSTIDFQKYRSFSGVICGSPSSAPLVTSGLTAPPNITRTLPGPKVDEGVELQEFGDGA
ncbi:NFX1-type zinc finger-containing protein [Zalerion maritima]|uniref:NFX1-type zinc finger-containing protein n=1 Tax=Zalerion maritima TaxID=339359 RepID=A0AAD5WSY2_9PEZI|nr:NFX1-type zinc finger-containing protein [Zalerion maritima]